MQQQYLHTDSNLNRLQLILLMTQEYRFPIEFGKKKTFYTRKIFKEPLINLP
jgi:hypothetical protein